METKSKIKECELIEAITVKEEENITEVAKKLRGTVIRHLFVVDANEKPTGIVSIVDINNRVVAEGKNLAEVKAKDIMSSPIDLIDVEDDVEETAKAMIEKNRAINAVVKDNKIIGIITLDRLIKKLN